jgi:hypothetical protein
MVYKGRMAMDACLKTLVLSPCVIASMLMMSTLAQADLTPMSTQELALTTGQAATGVQIGLQAYINQVIGAPGVASSACTTSETAATFCRLGFRLDGSTNWLVFKGFNGYINIPDIMIYGVNLSVATSFPLTTVGSPPSAVSPPQSAFAINIPFPNPANKDSTAIQIRNLSYTLGLNVNQATTTATDTPAYDQATYYQNTTYTNGTPGNFGQSNSTYDLSGGPGGGGRETGVIGVTMNGNLNVGGTLYVMSTTK